MVTYKKYQPKMSKYKQVLEYRTRPIPDCYDEIHREWIEDDSISREASFTDWLQKMVKKGK